MRAKIRVLILVGVAIILAAPAVTVAAAPADVDDRVEWTEVLGFDWVQGLVESWFGGSESTGTDGFGLDPSETATTTNGDEEGGGGGGGGNGGPGWDPNG